MKGGRPQSKETFDIWRGDFLPSGERACLAEELGQILQGSNPGNHGGAAQGVAASAFAAFLISLLSVVVLNNGRAQRPGNGVQAPLPGRCGTFESVVLRKGRPWLSKNATNTRAVVGSIWFPASR